MSERHSSYPKEMNTDQDTARVKPCDDGPTRRGRRNGRGGLRRLASLAPCRPAPPTRPPTAVVFDLGGVLIDWDPRHLYRRPVRRRGRRWRRSWPRSRRPPGTRSRTPGRPWAEAIAALAVERHPEQRDLIEAFHRGGPRCSAGPIEGTVEILPQLRDAGVAAVRPEQLVGRDIPGRARPLPVPRLVRRHRHLGRRRGDQARRPDLRAPRRPLRGSIPARRSSSTTARQRRGGRRGSASSRSGSSMRSALRRDLVRLGIIR